MTGTWLVDWSAQFWFAVLPVCFHLQHHNQDTANHQRTINSWLSLFTIEAGALWHRLLGLQYDDAG
jgi:hypothetical protein